MWVERSRAEPKGARSQPIGASCPRRGFCPVQLGHVPNRVAPHLQSFQIPHLEIASTQSGFANSSFFFLCGFKDIPPR